MPGMTGGGGTARQQRVQLLHEVHLERGWSRICPSSVLSLLLPLALDGPLTRSELHAHLIQLPDTRLGLNSPAWPPTDSELATGTTLSHPERSGQPLDRYTAALGLPPVRTLGGLLDFLLACGELCLDSDGRHELNPTAPLPAEILPLDPAEAALQDRRRWSRLHDPVAFALLRWLHPDSRRPVRRLRISLQETARELDADPESVRAAVLVLVEDGGLTASRDATSCSITERFRLTVCWPRFHATSYGIRFALLHALDQPPASRR